MEVIKNTASIIGLAMSLASFFALVSKSFRGKLTNFIRKYSNATDQEKSMLEIKGMLQKHVEEEQAFKEKMENDNAVMREFMLSQCRGQIKDMFYKYKNVKCLPMYERKTLLRVEKLYTGALEGNSWAKELIAEMKKWETDYDNSIPDFDEDFKNE